MGAAINHKNVRKIAQINQVYRVPVNPKAGFFFPYFFTIPSKLEPGLLILVNPNNDGAVGVSQAQREYFASILNEEMANVFGQAIGIVTLSPSFPRPKLNNKGGNLYIHALTREAVLTKQRQWQRIDKQLIAMHTDLKRRLSSLDINTDDKLLLYGFSAAADFVTRFAATHPNKVKAVVAGGLGGLPISPVSCLTGPTLSSADHRLRSGEGQKFAQNSYIDCKYMY